MENKIDWTIHYCVNGAVCQECGEIENGFLPYACNAHTHGLEKYHHLNFQLVLERPPAEIGYILNQFGIWVQAGHTFHSGLYVEGIYEDCLVRLKRFEEGGREVLRVIIPDAQYRFPGHPECSYPYKLQLLPTNLLMKKDGGHI